MSASPSPHRPQQVPSPGQRPAGIPGIIEMLRHTAPWSERIQAWRRRPARAGQTCAFPSALHTRLVEALQRRGILELRSHQASAIEAALAGQDVLVATPTASGKTLAYTLPILQRLLETGGSARALLLFPTKALAQDQTANLASIVEDLGEDWHVSTYDGDTPPDVRRNASGAGSLDSDQPLHAAPRNLAQPC